MELSSYFRINASKTGQFERTLIIAEEGSNEPWVSGMRELAMQQFRNVGFPT